MGDLLENSSFLMKLCRSKLAFSVIVIAIISLYFAGTYVNNYVFSEFGPDYIIEAIELDQKPEKFIPFSQLDSYGIQPIFGSSGGVEINYKGFHQILELITSYETFNVGYGNNYYRLKFDMVGDETLPLYPLPLIILSLIISVFSLILVILLLIIVTVNILKYLNDRFPTVKIRNGMVTVARRQKYAD